jgi:hypothetical protein
MNYTSFIVKILNKPQYNLCEQNIPLTETLGKFYQFRSNKYTICKVSFWGQPAYDALKYLKTSNYLIVEGYISLRESTFETLNITTNFEITVFRVYPFPLKIESIKN